MNHLKIAANMTQFCHRKCWPNQHAQHLVWILDQSFKDHLSMLGWEDLLFGWWLSSRTKVHWLPPRPRSGSPRSWEQTLLFVYRWTESTVKIPTTGQKQTLIWTVRDEERVRLWLVSHLRGRRTTHWWGVVVSGCRFHFISCFIISLYSSWVVGGCWYADVTHLLRNICTVLLMHKTYAASDHENSTWLRSSAPSGLSHVNRHHGRISCVLGVGAAESFHCWYVSTVAPGAHSTAT